MCYKEKNCKLKLYLDYGVTSYSVNISMVRYMGNMNKNKKIKLIIGVMCQYIYTLWTDLMKIRKNFAKNLIE